MTIFGVHFVAPFWLIGCAVSPLFYLLGIHLLARRKKAFAEFADEAVWTKIVPGLDWVLPARKIKFWTLACFFVFMAMARPQWGETEEIVKTTGLDIMLVVDVSQSMMAEDVIPNRMKKAQRMIRRLLERSSGDRVGLVAFAGNSILLAPLTTDLDYVVETAETLSVESVTLQGTDLGAGLETALGALERGAEDGSGKEDVAPVSKAIILISDGEDNEDQIGKIADRIRKEKLKLYVFGIGTEKGGPIPVRDREGNAVGFKRDRSGETVITRFNPASLEKLASEVDGRFWRVSDSEGELDQLSQALDGLSRGDLAEKTVTVRYERYQWPLALAILLFFLEMGLPAKRSLSFVSIALMLCASFPGLASADSGLRAYRENQKALKAFSEDKVFEAKEHIGNAQVEDPDSPRLLFNQGVIHMKEQRWDEAISAFESAVTQADETGDSRLSAAARYNQGISFTAKKDKEAAARAYINALEELRKTPDSDLEEKTRRNLELLFRPRSGKGDSESKDDSKEKGEKGESSDSESRSGKNDSSGDQNEKEKDQKDGENDSKGKDSNPGRYQESNGKREFKSQNLSKEEANRVLSELSRREKDLQEKMKRMKGRPQSLEKDW